MAFSIRDRIGLVLLGAFLVLSSLTAISVANPTVSIFVVDPRLDVVIHTTAALIGAAVAGLAWIHFREGARTASLFQASAFLVLAAVNAVFVGVLILGLDGPLGTSPSDSQQVAFYAWTAASFLAAVLLLLGAIAGRRTISPPTSARLIAVGPTLGLLLVFATVVSLRGRIPPILGVDFLVQGTIAGIFLAGALVYYWLHRSHGDRANAYLSLGLILAAFSQPRFAPYPAPHAAHVVLGDMFLIGFYVVLLLAGLAGARADARAVRLANADLTRLRDTEIAKAGLEERARLARELHDGLAQDLFFARLKQGRLHEIKNLPAEARELVDEIGSAIENALAEARQAVLAMQLTSTHEDSFADILGQYVTDFGDRFGLRAEFDAAGPAPRLAVRAQAELLRIVGEALNNVGKHADATVVRVTSEADDTALRLVVSDNGRGFDPTKLGDGGFGIQSMRERAVVIGAAIRIESRPLDGTRVITELPLGNGAG